MTRQLIIEPICGLSNRLLALASARYVADHYDRQLVLIWGSNYPSQSLQSNCRFDDLFLNDLPHVDSFDQVDADSLIRLVKTPRFIPWEEVQNPRVLTLQPSRAIDLSPYQDVPVIGLTTFNLVFVRAERPEVQIIAAARFLLTLRPVSPVNRAVDEFRLTQFTGPTLGVHIRRGDHGAMLERMGLQQPSEEDFWAYVEACLSSRPGLRAYCASDDAGVKERFIHRFGHRACSYDVTSFDRSTPCGIRYALIDLLLLSYADVICGTPKSTFTQTAALWHLSRGCSEARPAIEITAGIRNDSRTLSETATRTLAILDAG
jgi:hypothetical protein